MTSGSDVDGTFAGIGDYAEVAVLIVTYNSAREIGGLLDSLRLEASTVAMRVVVADNESTDDTVRVVTLHSDVTLIHTGGNLGYSAGINAAAQHAGDTGSQLILNPDLVVRPGAVRALLNASLSHPHAGVIAPLIVDEKGDVSPSIFNEPRPLRAFADALLGRHWRSRPSWVSEWVRSPSAYEHTHKVDWVTGAAMLITSAAARAVGEWDEAFFLYSEETDFCRRTRDAGFDVLFVPTAVVQHSQGGSGASPALDTLLAVNRVRYMRKHSPRTAETYRRISTLGAALRSRNSPSQRMTRKFLAQEKYWPELPSGSWSGFGNSPALSIVIPAHNESAVIARTLDRLSAAAARGTVDVHVVCNGCTDDTAAIARSYPGVRVTELRSASKTIAVNEGLRAARLDLALVLDADIDFPTTAIPSLVRHLNTPGILGARPPFVYDVTRSDQSVRAYYRARLRMPAMSQALWGAGAYALNGPGMERVGELPNIVADDFYVDSMIESTEKAIPLSASVTVRMPRTASALVGVLTRARRGPAQLGVDGGKRTAVSLAKTVRGPFSLWDAMVYLGFSLTARGSARQGRTAGWERDETSRGGPPTKVSGKEPRH